MLKLEGLPTVNTFTRLLPSMNDPMYTEVVPGLEGLPTVSALVRRLPTMDFFM